MKDLNNIIDNDKISEIYDFSIDNFYNEYGEKYIGKMKYNFKIKGILFFDKNDKIKRKKYEGDFKNNLRDGKGKIYWNDGERYEGDWKNDKWEGKGIYYWNDGRKYDGDWNNNKKEGKGIFYWNDGDRDMGDYSNDQPIGKHARLTKSGEVKTINH